MNNTQSQIPMTNYTAVLPLIILFLFALFSCKKDDVDRDGNSISKVRIKDASLLFLTDGQKGIGTSSLSMLAGSDTRSQQVSDGLSDILFKQTGNGKVEPVYFIKENGDSVIMRVSRLYEFSNKYVLLYGDFTLKKETFFYILVNVHTEEIYGLPFYPNEFEFLNPKVEVDKNGNLYFASARQMIYKLDTRDPNNFKIEEYLPQNQSFYDFMVNPEGICFYGNPTTNNVDQHKFKLPSGKIITARNLTSDFELDFLSFNWVFYGINGDYYFTKQTSYLSGAYNLYRINFVNEEAVTHYITSLDVNYTGGIAFMPNPIKRTFFALQGKIFEFDETTNSVKTYPFALPNDNWSAWDFSKAGFTNNHWVIPPRSNGSMLLKISLSDYSVSAVPIGPEGAFEFYSFTMNPKSNTVSFTGLRYSDGKNVVGSVDEQNNVTITAVEQGRPINLVKLN